MSAPVLSSRRTIPTVETLENRLVPDAKSFVTGLYQNLLNRAPDTAGLNNWVAAITVNGASNQAVATAIWRSAEHRGIEVDSFYQTILGRNADPVGRQIWVNVLLNNQANELGIENIFLNSAEYLVSHDTPSAFVTGVYLDVLGRSPTINEEASWQGVLAAFGSNTVTTSIISSAESLTRIVANDYTTYLNRTPDSGGLNLWLSQLQTGRGTVETVAESILGSAEYAAKH